MVRRWMPGKNRFAALRLCWRAMAVNRSQQCVLLNHFGFELPEMALDSSVSPSLPLIPSFPATSSASRT